MKKIILPLLFSLFTNLIFAQQHFNYDGVITKTLNTPSPKQVTLMKIEMSDQLKNTFKKNLSHHPMLKANATSNHAIQLGMNQIPVADQGLHGSCVVFAITAALNAIKGQPLSELCTLSLGQYIEMNGYRSSGWHGQIIRDVMSRLDDYGIISLNQQKQHGCGGMTEYPTKEFNLPNPMSPEEYRLMSQSLDDVGLDSWSNYYDINQWINKNIPGEQVLSLTKKALLNQHRVVIGVLIPALFGNLGASGQYHEKYDTWVITSEIEDLIKHIDSSLWLWGGHAMVITGFDDNALSIDDEGKTHKGLLTLRNSWGSEAGDHGDFYMSYDYFMHLALELEEISTNEEGVK